MAERSDRVLVFLFIVETHTQRDLCIIRTLDTAFTNTFTDRGNTLGILPEVQVGITELGNAHLNLGQYTECISAIREGVRKGGIKSPDNAQISLGMCLYNEKEYQDAIAAFRQAGKTQRSARISRQWISVIESDIERNRQIRPNLAVTFYIAFNDADPLT